MKDKNGVELNVGDWVLYQHDHKNLSSRITKVEGDFLGIFSIARIKHNNLDTVRYGNTIEKLPEDAAERTHILFLRELEN